MKQLSSQHHWRLFKVNSFFFVPNSEKIDTDLYNGPFSHCSIRLRFHTIIVSTSKGKILKSIRSSHPVRNKTCVILKNHENVRCLYVHVFPKKIVYAVESCVQAPYAANY